MATQPLGRISEVNVRDIWPDEAHNFTRWLAEQENLNLLGNELGIHMEVLQQEATVGRYRLDILAREAGGTGRKISIENQLGYTDHSHLGQLLTYTAGIESRIVIWIARSFTEEHRAVIDWLNRWTPVAFEFYGVEIHAIIIGESIAAPDFRVVAPPDGWTRERQPTPVSPSPFAEQYREFFQPLVDDLHLSGFTDKTQAEPTDSQRFPTSSERYSYYVSLEDEQAWVYLWLYGGPLRRDFINAVFDRLHEHRDEIEAELGINLDWQKLGNWWYSYVALASDGLIDDPPQKQAETRAWMLETLPRFREVFNPRLEKILAELETE